MADEKLKNNRAAGSSKARNRINLRVSEAEYEQLVREAAGKTTISALVHRRVFGGGMRNHDVLRQVAALHHLGMEVKALAQNPAVRTLEVQATLAKVRLAIQDLAKRLP
jgi:hypothetical protein